MTNLHCCHCLGGRWPGSSFLLWFSIKLWQFNIQYLTKHKLNIWSTSLLLNFCTKETFFRLKKNFTLWHEIIDFNEFSVLLDELNSATTPWLLEVKINIILLKCITQSSKYSSIWSLSYINLFVSFVVVV